MQVNCPICAHTMAPVAIGQNIVGWLCEGNQGGCEFSRFDDGEPDQHPPRDVIVCEECGCPRVELRVMVGLNGPAIDWQDDGDRGWCPGCEAEKIRTEAVAWADVLREHRRKVDARGGATSCTCFQARLL